MIWSFIWTAICIIGFIFGVIMIFAALLYALYLLISFILFLFGC